MEDKMQRFFDKMRAERRYQADRWAEGDEDALDRVDDEKNNTLAWVGYLCHHATRWFPGGFPPFGTDVMEIFKSQMVKVAATAYAAHEWAQREIDRRKKGEEPRA